jgi:ABC-2 type transport system permease protein
MNKTWIVLKTEFINTVKRRSFLLALILVPLVPALILGVMSLIKQKEPSEDADGISVSDSSIDTQLPQGYLDFANIIKSSPEWLGKDQIIPFHQEDEARKAVLSGEISGFFIIQPDYIYSGSIQYISQDFNPFASLDSTWKINTLIQYNLLGGDQEQFDSFFNPMQVQYVDLLPGEGEEGIDFATDAMSFYIPYGMTMLFYVLILASASLMMNGITKEKENRVMEILVSSIKPRELLAGKILGLGLVGLLQLVVWLGSAFILLRLAGKTLLLSTLAQLPINVLFWGVIFFILGYLVYATIMAGVGALVGTVKEASQATFIVILPILIPVMLSGVIANQPNASLAVILSLIPFTAPNAIMTRIAITDIPLWQLLLSVGLLIITIILLIRAVAGMFKTQLLLTGQKFSLTLFFKALRGKHPSIINRQP